MLAVGSLILAMRLFSQSSPGAQKLQAFVAAFNTGRQGKVLEFLQANFQPELATDDFAKRVIELKRIGLPVKLGKLLVDEPGVAITELTSSSGDAWELKMTFRGNLGTSIMIGGPGSQSRPPKSYDSWSDYKDLLTQISKDTGVPAIGLATFENGKTHAAAVGARNVGLEDRVTLNDRWLIGSITKSMTATMIARLVDRGILHWNTTVGQVFPNMPMRDGYRSVTLLQLLQHRSGVQQDRYVTDAFINEAAGPGADVVKLREHYAAYTLQRPPLFAPGESMAYSNAGYSIAAHIAETVAGKPYETLMQELVFDPLGMSSAKIGVPGAPGNPGSAGQPSGHMETKKGPVRHLMDIPKLVGIQAPAGLGVSMSLGDLLKFAEFHLAGLRGTQNFISRKNFTVLHQAGDPTPGAYQYACGWVIDDKLTPETFHGHNGSDGTFFAEIAIWPSRSFAAVAITNIGTQTSPSPPMQAILAAYRRATQSRQ